MAKKQSKPKADEAAVEYVDRFQAFVSPQYEFPHQPSVRTRTFVRDNAMRGALMCECASAMAANDIADALNRKHNGFAPSPQKETTKP